MVVRNAARAFMVCVAIAATAPSQNAAPAGAPQGASAPAAPRTISAPDANGVIYIEREKVAAAPAQGGWLVAPEGNRTFKVLAVRRQAPGEAEVHAQDNDVFYVLEGSAKFVTGGTVAQPRNTAPEEVRGSGIQGGQARALHAGDVIVIPKGVPHWFQEVTPGFLYFVVKSR